MNVDQAVNIVARELLYSATQDEEWGNYPEIGEYDWYSILHEAQQIAGRPSAAEYKGAYGLLEARANVDEKSRSSFAVGDRVWLIDTREFGEAGLHTVDDMGDRWIVRRDDHDPGDDFLGTDESFMRHVYDAESAEPPADIKVRDFEGDVWSSTAQGWTRGNDPVSWPALLVMTDTRHHPLVEWREGDPR